MYRICLLRVPRFNIEINILYDIAVSGGVQSFETGIYIVPHTIAGKNLGYLFAGQMLGVLVDLCAINEKIALTAHLYASSGKTKLPVFFSSSYMLNRVSGLKCHSLVSSCSSKEYTSDL